MSELYAPVQLNDSIRRSRGLLPNAVGLLCELIAEVTGRAPERERVEHVGRFWLMQACDRVVAESDGISSSHADAVAPSSPSSLSARSRLLERFGERNAAVCVVEPYLKVPILTELSAAVRARRVMHWHSTPRVDLGVSAAKTSARQSVAGRSSSSDRLIEVLRTRVALGAPMDLVEHHHTLSEWAERHPMAGLRLLYTANAHQSSTPFRFVSFSQRRRGGKLLVHQHGGGYGIDEQHLGEDCDIAMSDVFYTWGWGRPDVGSRVRALPSALPPRRKGKRRRGYLLMSLPVTSHVYRLQPFLMPSHIELCVNETISFLAGMSNSAPITIRSSGSQSFPMARIPDTSVEVHTDDLSESGTEAAARSTLVIHNYLGTSWLETLAMNVPTICFFNPEIYAPREAARPYVDALARVGVIHHSGADAAKFVNQLNGNPDAWWNSSEVQEARQAFVARYANFSDDWLQAWSEEFERLLAE